MELSYIVLEHCEWDKFGLIIVEQVFDQDYYYLLDMRG
jgi:hypothetical protein